MKFRVLGDHSDVHCGSAAVIEVLRTILRDAGDIVSAAQDCDVLIVNGEGSMHHDSIACREKLEAIEAAQERGIQTWLVNSVWQQNGSSFDNVLRRLNGLWLRGPRSADDLRNRHAIEAGWGLDLSYFAAVEEVVAPVDYAGETVVTDYWDANYAQFVRPTAGGMAGMPFLDMHDFSWPGLIASIRTSRLLITGRHHAMYAACRARRPFIPLVANTHKMEDLLRGAPCSIPICGTSRDVHHARNWLQNNPGEFDRLFDWMEKQEIWRFGESARHNGPGRTRSRQIFFEARTQLIRNRPADALAIIDDQIRTDPTDPALHGIRRNARLASGAVVDAALTTAEDRLRSPQNVGLDHEYSRVVRAAPDASIDTTAPHWSAVARIMRGSAFQGDARDLIHEAMTCPMDDVSFEAVRGVLDAVLSMHRDWEGTEIVESLARARGQPDWLSDYDRLVLTVRRYRFGETHADDVAHNVWRPEFRTEQKLDAIEYLIRAGRIDRPLVDRIRSMAGSPGREPDGQFACLAAAAAASAGLDDLSGEIAHSIPRDHALVDKIAALSSLLGDGSPSGLGQFHHQCRGAIGPVQEALGDRGRSIALVGNGVPVNPSAGKAIDAHDIVLRFNDFRLSGLQAAVGTRTSLIPTVRHASPGLDQPNIPSAELGVILTAPALLFTRQDWRHVLQCWREGTSICLLPDTVRLGLQARLGVSPSSGLHIAMLVQHLRQGSAGLSLFHTPLLQGAGQYSRHRGLASTRHHWAGEIALVREHALNVQ